MNSKLVLAVIVILLLLYVIFKALTTTYTSLGTMQKWGNATTLQGSNLPSSFKANSAISIWFYIKKWVNGTKVIEFKKNEEIIFQIRFMDGSNVIKILPRSGQSNPDLDCSPMLN